MKQKHESFCPRCAANDIGNRVLGEANNTLKSRASSYGDKDLCFELITEFWNSYLGMRWVQDENTKLGYHYELTKRDVATLFILSKVARAATGKFHWDNYIDICGYAALAAEL